MTDQGGDRLEKSIRNPDDLSAEEVEARLGIPATAPTRVRQPAIEAGTATATEPLPVGTTRRRVLWRDSATILIGVVLALLVARFLLPSGPASAVGSPSPEDTGLVAVASLTLSPTVVDTSAPTFGNVVPPSLHLDATPTPIPVITLPPATPRPQPTPTLQPGQTPSPTPAKTPTPTPHKTPAPTPPPAPIAKVTCSVPTGSMTVTCSGVGTLYAVTYEWTFGDGATATGKTPPPHPYATNGTYTVTLTATNATGSDSQNAFAMIPGP